MRSSEAFVLAFLASAVFSIEAQAAPRWVDAPYKYVILDQDIRLTLTDFGRNLGVPIVLSDAITGRVRGGINAEKAGEFIDQLASASGLNWYFDGAVLYVSSTKEFATHILDAGRLDGETIITQMQELGFADKRFSLRTGRRDNVLIVSGPPAYIDVVTELIARLQPEPPVVAEDLRVRIIRGGTLTDVLVPRPAESGSAAKSLSVNASSTRQDLR